MEFRIADTFTDSLGRLTAQEQKAVKTTAFDLQMDASAPGLSFHKLDRAVDKNFWSVRVNADIRLIVHRGAASLLLAYVDHHDKAYRWAERRKIERHPTTGAMQLVEVRERVEELSPKPKPAAATPGPKLFAGLRKLEIMAFGVPEEWVNDVREATEASLFDLLPHLPQEAQESLLRLAVGEKLAVPEPVPADSAADPFAHPDAQQSLPVRRCPTDQGRGDATRRTSIVLHYHGLPHALRQHGGCGAGMDVERAGGCRTDYAAHRLARPPSLRVRGRCEQAHASEQRGAACKAHHVGSSTRKRASPSRRICSGRSSSH